MLCVPFKILERMILSHIEPVVDPQLPREQAGFRRGRSTVDQVTLLTQDIEDSFQANEKAGVVLLDLTVCIRHCLAPWTSPEAAKDHPRPPYGEVPNGDAVQPQLHPPD